MQVLEVEQKYAASEELDLTKRLLGFNAVLVGKHEHEDTYYAHPSRDFRLTGEALRVRKIDGAPLITYKGPKLSSEIKVRKELEWGLSPGDEDGSKTMEMLDLLGFRVIATVRKTRVEFRASDAETSVVIDQVDGLGCFVEIERLVSDQSELTAAKEAIEKLGIALGLKKKVNQSYLGMLLQLSAR